MPDVRPLAGAALAAGGLLVGLGLGEGLLRWLDPTPRVQFVDLTAPDLTTVEDHGAVLWYTEDDPGLVRGDCAGQGAPTVLLAGDSVFKVPGIDGILDRRVRDVLQARLSDALGRPACVLDASQAGYVPHQQLAAARHATARHAVDVVVFQVWKVDRRYTRLGTWLYDVEPFARDSGGVPIGPLDLPDPLNRWLFDHSRLWRTVALAASPNAEAPRPFDASYVEAMDWAQQVGLPLVMAEAAPLSGAIADYLSRRVAGDLPYAEGWVVDLQAEATRRGVPYLLLAEALRDADLDQIRLDACCHLRPEGHRLVAEALVPPLLAALAEPEETL